MNDATSETDDARFNREMACAEALAVGLCKVLEQRGIEEGTPITLEELLFTPTLDIAESVLDNLRLASACTWEIYEDYKQEGYLVVTIDRNTRVHFESLCKLATLRAATTFKHGALFEGFRVHLPSGQLVGVSRRTISDI